MSNLLKHCRHHILAMLSRLHHTLILIAGSSKLLEREKMRFDISTFTSTHPHVEIDQSLPHPAIRRSGSVN